MKDNERGVKKKLDCPEDSRLVFAQQKCVCPEDVRTSLYFHIDFDKNETIYIPRGRPPLGVKVEPP